MVCCVFLWFGIGWYYPYPSGLLHWHWSNHMIAPVPLNLTQIHQGYFTGTGAIIWLPQHQWNNPQDMGWFGIGQSYPYPSGLLIWLPQCQWSNPEDKGSFEIGQSYPYPSGLLHWRWGNHDCPSATKVTLRIRVGLGLVNLTHILQGYFTGTGAIIWLPQCQWSNPEDKGSFGIGQSYPYPSGLLHWHWGNHMIAPVPVK